MAQDAYPNRPIKMLVGFPGRRTERRAGAHHRRETAGRARPAGGGGEQDRRRRHDRAQRNAGAAARRLHAACCAPTSIRPTRMLYKKVTYKLEDLAPVTMVSKAYYAFVVPPIVARQQHEGIHRAMRNRSRARSITASVGSGSVTELLPKQLEKEAGITDDRRHLPRHRPRDAGRSWPAGSTSWSARCRWRCRFTPRRRSRSSRMTSPERLADRARRADAEGAGRRHRRIMAGGACARRRACRSRCSKSSTSTWRGRGRRPNEYKIDDGKNRRDSDFHRRREFGKIITETAAEAAKMLKDLGIEQIDQ